MYFFGPRECLTAAVGGAGVQEIKATVKGGYTPGVIVVEQGRPIRLDFYRDETASCSEEVVFGDFGIASHLPAFQTTPIEFAPDKPDESTFTCAIIVMRGKLIVEPGGWR
jgi:plastocyanin domain-containing protein